MLAGCAGVLGFDEFVVGPGTMDGGDDAAPSGGDADVYVSVEGSDEGDGSRQHPVRSVARGVQLARAGLFEKKGVQRVAVCAGEYVEKTLEIVGGIHVLGGYDCASWARSATEQSLVLSIPPSTRLMSDAPGPAFVRLRADQLGAPRLDGLSIAATQAFATIDVVGESALVDLFVDNTAPPADVEPRQVVAANQANVTIERSHFAMSQRESTSKGVGIGVSASESTLTLRDNVVEIASTAGACQGLVASASTVVAERNQLDMFECTAVTISGKELSAAIGLVMIDSTLTSRRNMIRMDRPRRFEAGRAGAVGMTIVRGGLDSDGDRIIGPVLLGEQATSLTFVGYYASAPVKIVNASIVLDSRAYDLESGSVGIDLADGSDESTIAHDSMYISAPAPTDQVRSYMLRIAGSVQGGALKVDSNLAISDNPDAVFIRVGSCAEGAIGKLANNFHGGFAAPVLVQDGGACTLDELVDGGAAANAVLPCNAGECRELFEGTEPLSVATKGLRPAPAAACAQLQVPSSPDVRVDGTGNARSDGGTTTAGAFEVGCN